MCNEVLNIFLHFFVTNIIVVGMLRREKWGDWGKWGDLAGREVWGGLATLGKRGNWGRMGKWGSYGDQRSGDIGEEGKIG